MIPGLLAGGSVFAGDPAWRFAAAPPAMVVMGYQAGGDDVASGNGRRVPCKAEQGQRLVPVELFQHVGGH